MRLTSKKTYRTFYLENKDKLFSYLIRLTGDYHLSCDAMQDGFTRLLSHYGPNEQSVPLLYKIARNAVTDHLRRRQRNGPSNENHIEDVRNPEERTLVREAYREVLAAMEGLEKTERDVLAMSVSSGLSYREIADVVGISEANVRVKIHRARVKLRKNLQLEEDKRWIP